MKLWWSAVNCVSNLHRQAQVSWLNYIQGKKCIWGRRNIFYFITSNEPEEQFLLYFINRKKNALPLKDDTADFKNYSGNRGEVHKICFDKENKSRPSHHLRFFLWVTKKKEQVTAASPSLSLLLCREVSKSRSAAGAEQPLQWVAHAVCTPVAGFPVLPLGEAHTHVLQEWPPGSAQPHSKLKKLKPKVSQFII